jgi:predicted peptidase
LIHPRLFVTTKGRLITNLLLENNRCSICAHAKFAILNGRDDWFEMTTRREALSLMASASVGGLITASDRGLKFPFALNASAAVKDTQPPTLAPGAPLSPERMALIEAFKKESEGLQSKFEARTHKSNWVMPYRLFRPQSNARVPLVVYLHGGGGVGDDNEKQLALGNIFGTRVWLLPDNQKRFPCYVVAPQTDRGWIRYDLSKQPAQQLPGLGDGNRLTLEIVDRLCREFPIDQSRIYVTGQSMGGAGTWNIIAHRPKLFAAAVICCGAGSSEDGTAAIDLPVWNFHGDSDKTVPVSLSRDRIAARRKAGGRPFYTEYAGVDHNCWQWAYTEPELIKWVFTQRRA